MLKLTDIKKDYVTGDSVVNALKGVSIEFRQSEFVSILGQSGCGKTTLLNIIGGLDQYTSGDLVINGKSTKEYGDREWDTYRNHSVGFVFQSYNLIPHQTVLANVELALTLSGVSKDERRKRAIEALETVGLGEQIKKRPNQLSGGQMQRVAIARALVNDPDILLADEPTGALDSETSVQIMELLKAISNDKLIIMVTHNPDLAKEYSTRIINLLDGKVISDSDPYTSPVTEKVQASVSAKAYKKNKLSELNEKTLEYDNILANLKQSDPQKYLSKKNEFKEKLCKEKKAIKEAYKNLSKAEKEKRKEQRAKDKKTSMSFLTALSLSKNNLMTKKGRTFLTAFAGSIGIIGIALILSVSSGVSAYITSIEKGTMSSYPLEIRENSMDLMTVMGSLMEESTVENPAPNTIYSHDVLAHIFDSGSRGLISNNLTKFQEYIKNSEIFKTNATDVKYSYDAKLNTYYYDKVTGWTPTIDGIVGILSRLEMGWILGDSSSIGETANSLMGGSAFKELVGDEKYVQSQYTKLYGEFPTKPNEVVLIVDKNQQISDFTLYTLGIKNIQELENFVNSVKAGQIPEPIESKTYTFDYLCGYEFKVVPESEKYKLTDDGRIEERDDAEIAKYLETATTLKIVGILTPNENAASSSVIGSIGYRADLMTTIIDKSNEGAILEALKNSDVDLSNGLPFAPVLPNLSLVRKNMRNDILIFTGGEVDVNRLSDIQLISFLKGALASNPAMEKLLTFKEDEEDQNGAAPWGGYTKEYVQQYIYPMLMAFSQTASKPETTAFLQSILNNITTVENGMENLTLLVNSLLYENLSENPDVNKQDALEYFGNVDYSKPTTILIYPKDFDAKQVIKDEIEKYNSSQEDENDRITYSDTVAMLMSSVTTIVNAITYVLVAFVAISLIVSSIMIGIITYISVLERTKEIGILRAIGASKKDVSRVFNAETLIVGFTAGVIGILVSLFFVGIINIILGALTGLETLKAVLPFGAAVILVLISMGLTLIAGDGKSTRLNSSH